MLLKTKLLISLGTLGVAGGTSAGVYFIKNKDENSINKKQEKLKEEEETQEQRKNKTPLSTEAPAPENNENSASLETQQ